MTPDYRQVMVSWAVAELMSPHWRKATDSIWANPSWEPWREWVRRNGRDAWSPDQAEILVKAVEHARKPIIDAYGPRPGDRLTQRELTTADLAALHVMPEFFPPGGTVRQLLDWVRARPDYAPEKNAAIQAMLVQAQAPMWPFESLIVARRADGAQILIEGYKRAMASLTVGRRTTPAFLVGS